MVQSHKDFVDGVTIEDIQNSHNDAIGADDKGFGTGLQGRAAIWAGTGLGLVNEVRSAADIVEEVRAVAREVLARAAKL